MDIEHDEHFQRYDGKMLAGSKVANLGSQHLLDLLSDRPIIWCGTLTEQETVVVSSSDTPLHWEFALL